jgi:beta-lactam-binding protein with PASTA domain
MIFNPPFIKKLVNAGEPVTAQAWNDIVNGLGQVHGYLETTEATALRVQVTATGIDPAAVRVTAVREGISFEAVRPVAPLTQHVFAGLRPGSYAVRAEAPGFDPASQNVTVPTADVQAITLAKKGAFMPMVFGQELQAALAALQNLGIAVARIMDVTGVDVPTANPGAQFNSARVLMQFPLSGAPVAPGESAHLVVSASLQVESSIEIPPLTGLTLAEAQKALEGLGLVLGKVVTKQRQAQ